MLLRPVATLYNVKKSTLFWCCKLFAVSLEKEKMAFCFSPGCDTIKYSLLKGNIPSSLLLSLQINYRLIKKKTEKEIGQGKPSEIPQIMGS
jgi:hypothetical protein